VDLRHLKLYNTESIGNTDFQSDRQPSTLYLLYISGNMPEMTNTHHHVTDTGTHDLRLPSFPPRIERGDLDLFATCVKEASVPLHVIQPNHPHLHLDNDSPVSRHEAEGMANPRRSSRWRPFCDLRQSFRCAWYRIPENSQERHFPPRRPLLRCASKTGHQS
jgi:hypothetical protein